MTNVTNSISVILPNYNHAKHIKRAVDAILAQDAPPAEIIIVDDGSSDDSLAVIESLVQASPLIRLIKNETNQGVVAAQTRALSVATGSLVHLAAADDMILPGFYSLGIRMLAQYPAAGLFTGDSLLFDGTSGQYVGMRPFVMPRFTAGYLSPTEVRKALAKSDNWILTGASLIRLDVLNACGGLHPDLGPFVDGFLTRKIALTRGYCYAPVPASTWTIFTTGISRSAALNPAKSEALREVSQACIAADPSFPSWYAERFGERLSFANARVALDEHPINVSTVLALGTMAAADKAVVGMLLSISEGQLGRIATLAWLFLRLRPFRLTDIIATFFYRKLFARKFRQMSQMAQINFDRHFSQGEKG